jgi:hypothetical protein
MTTTSKEKDAPTEPEPEPAPEEVSEPDRPMPTNVIEAIRRVMEDLPGIAKVTGAQHRKRTGQSSSDDTVPYAYRSIEQITAEAQRLFGKYGVVFIPEVIPPPDPKLAEREFTQGQKGTRWTDTYLTVNYRIFGPGGMEDVVTAGPFMGIGRDNSDKGYNKAMTQVFKQALLQILCIGDPQDEGEHERHTQEGAQLQGEPGVGRGGQYDAPSDPWWKMLGYVDEDEARSLNDSLRDLITALTDDGKAVIRKWALDHGYVSTNDPTVARHPIPVKKEDAPALREAIKSAATGQIGEEPAAAPAQPGPEQPTLPQAAEEQPPGPANAEPAQPPTAGPAEAPAAAEVPERHPSLDGAPIPPGFPDSEVDGITAVVKLMPAPAITKGLESKDLPTTGNLQTKRARLAMAMIHEKAAEMAAEQAEPVVEQGAENTGDTTPTEG